MSVRAFECLACGHTQVSADSPRCDTCGGPLDPIYPYDDIDPATLTVTDPASMWAFDAVLPTTRSAAVSMGEGGTPLVDASETADRLGIDRLYIKDEGQTPTGTVHDRGFAAAVSALDEATEVGLASTGVGGQSAAAYAARAGFSAHVYIPARASFGSQAMVNVHGADMNVVEGRYPETREAFESAATDWYRLGPFETPYRHDGLKTVFYEIAATLEWTAPDIIVTPAGHGELPYAIAKAADELERLGVIETIPRVALVQPEACAPISRALETGADRPEVWETPDTICGGLEVTDPEGGQIAIDAVEATDGVGITRPDAEILAAACQVAADDGLAIGTGGGAAVAGAAALRDEGNIGPDETVVALNTTAAMQQVDVIRSHLMSPEWERRA